jgi:protease-4
MLTRPLFFLGLFVVLSGCIVIPIGDLLKGPVLQEQVLVQGAGFFSQEKIAIIDVEGVITGEESGSVFTRQRDTVSETKARLNYVSQDPEVKAVVLRVSSPGGEVTACDVLHHEIARFKKKTGIPVVSFISGQGASGGYYLAVAGDTILANPTAIVGSIGVVLQHFDLSDLLGNIGVKVEPIKSSAGKDLNSPFRRMTGVEREVLQNLVNDMYERFVDVVTENRSELTREQVLAVADGRVLSGIEAAKAHLVDRVGYVADALEEAKQRANIQSATVVRYTRIPSSGANIYTESAVPQPSARQVHVSFPMDLTAGPKLLYLWRPLW